MITSVIASPRRCRAIPLCWRTRATDVTVVPVEGDAFEHAINDLAERCDLIYFHIDSDILDESLVPNHGTKCLSG